MGHEVMDEHGSTEPRRESFTPGSTPSSAAGGPGDQTEPFDLGELDASTGQSGAAEPGSAAGRLRSWSRHLAADHSRKSLVSAAVVVLALGALTGGALEHQRSEYLRTVREDSTVTALAVVENQLVGGRNGVRTTTLSVRLRNLGPKAITVQTSPPGTTPLRDRPLITATAEQAVAPAHGDTMVLVEVPVPCRSNLPAVSLPIRTVDGVGHRVQVEAAANNNDILNSDTTMCGQDQNGGEQVISASLDGSVQHPTVVLRNTSDQPRKVWRITDGVTPRQPVTLTISPTLPRTIPAHGTLTLDVSLTDAHCVRDLHQLDVAAQYAWISLVDTDPDVDVAPTTVVSYPHSTGVGLSTLVTNALVTACP